MKREPAGTGFEVADRGARLQWRNHHAVVDHRKFRDVSRRPESAAGRPGITDLPVQYQIARRLVPDLRSTYGESLGGADRGIERMVVDIDEFARVVRRRPAFRNHEGDRLADMAHPVRCQHRMGNRRQGCSVPVGKSTHKRYGTDAFGLQVGGRQDQAGARRMARRGAIDTGDGGMGVRRPQHHAPQLAGKVHIIGIAAQSPYETGILGPQIGLSDTEEHARRSLIFRRWPTVYCPPALAPVPSPPSCVRRAAHTSLVDPFNSHPNRMTARRAPAIWATMNAGMCAGTIPEKVSVRLRAMVTAGFANEVDEVYQ